MNRRHLLRGVALLGVGLAGCTENGDGSGGDDGLRVSDVSMSVEGKQLTISVHVSNTGANRRSGVLRATITLPDGEKIESEKTIAVDPMEVPPPQTVFFLELPTEYALDELEIDVEITDEQANTRTGGT